jgi:hypothetical protein
MAEESELAPFQRLAKTFRKGADKIVAFCKHRITSGKIEGFNNLVSRVVHRACGIINFAYAWLKFRQLSIHPANQTESHFYFVRTSPSWASVEFGLSLRTA